ncbi:hypothetical protein TNCV_5136691 [Trichonephila clavipes]|nr:hypothetical protein TNCV_5136691 [Trichonephila clavipes]
MVASGIEPRSSGLESDALTTRLPSALEDKDTPSGGNVTVRFMASDGEQDAAFRSEDQTMPANGEGTTVRRAGCRTCYTHQ